MTPQRLQEMRTEWETERKMLLKDKARIRGELRDVEYRLKVFFGSGK
jgi:abortive infection bacteriophage resistance protein